MKRILSCVLVMVLLVSLAGCGGSKCTSIVLSASDVSLSQPGQTKGLTVTKEPADATDKVAFKSSDPSVATVDEYGLITAVGEGNTTITVTCGDAVAFCEVTVGSGGTNNPGNNSQQGGSQTNEPDESNTQPQGPVTVDCPDCGGSGGSTCRYCDGAYECKDCGGSGEDPDYKGCDPCEGSGFCKYCDGTGEYRGLYRGDKCEMCDGSGVCSACDGSGLPRYGMGARPCGGCAGFGVCQKCDNGIVECRTCGGEGQITTANTNAQTQQSTGNRTTSGQQNAKCNTCGDTGNCPYCGGIDVCPNDNCFNGREECESCYGTGDCERCYGLGYSTVNDRDCSYCTDGECRSCGGKGEWECKTCGGTGECNYCDYGFCPACGG